MVGERLEWLLMKADEAVGFWEWVMVEGVLDVECKCMYVLYLKQAMYNSFR